MKIGRAIRAVRAIKQNYRWRSVIVVLKAPMPEYARINYIHDHPLPPGIKTWQAVLTAPESVIGWQAGLAEGVFL